MARDEILATLEAAPLLGLVPRGQLHAWLASVQQHGMTPEILQLLQEGLDVPWCSRVRPGGGPQSELVGSYHEH